MSSEMMLVGIFIYTMPAYLSKMLILEDIGNKCAVDLDDLSGSFPP